MNFFANLFIFLTQKQKTKNKTESFPLLLALLEFDQKQHNFLEIQQIYTFLTALSPGSPPSFHRSLSSFAQSVGHTLLTIQHSLQDLGYQVQQQEQEQQQQQQAVFVLKERKGRGEKGLEKSLWESGMLYLSTLVRSMQLTLIRSLLLRTEGVIIFFSIIFFFIETIIFPLNNYFPHIQIPPAILHNCDFDIQSPDFMSENTITLQKIDDLLGSCLSKQKTLSYLESQVLLSFSFLFPSPPSLSSSPPFPLPSQGSSFFLPNDFGWTPLHQFACINDEKTYKKLLEISLKDEDADVDVADWLGQTPLHVSVLMRSYSVARSLLDSGASMFPDAFGHTPRDLFCEHKSEKGCKIVPELCVCTKRVKKLVGGGEEKERRERERGGWPVEKSVVVEAVMETSSLFASPSASSSSSSCSSSSLLPITSIDAQDLPVDRFISDFLTTGRPVLVRNAISDPSFMSRFQLEKLFFSENSEKTHNISSVPYASTFSLPSTSLTLREYLSTWAMGGEDSVPPLPPSPSSASPPDYLFTSMSQDDILTQNIDFPAFLDPSFTNLTVRKSQFFAGPSGSGAPIHFHGAAFNMLAYGKVFLFPAFIK